MEEIYDIIILGGGPAGMSAGIYASQTKQRTLLIENSKFGGQIATTSMVTNYLGFEKITGKDLSDTMHNHLLSVNSVDILNAEIFSTKLDEDIKEVVTSKGVYQSHAVIIAIGTQSRKLGVDNESKYLRHGLTYNTLMDRDKFEGKNVAVIGGGNTAIEDAIYISEKAKKVYLIHRRQEFRADMKLVEDLKSKIADEGKIELVLECKPKEIIGKEDVEKLVLTHIPDDQDVVLDVQGIFVCIGRGANTDIIDEKVERDSSGYIITNDRMETNLPGVYATGDIRTTPLRQIVTAVADGAIASTQALTYNRKFK